MKFRALFVDADNTLFDFDAGQKLALEATLKDLSLPDDADAVSVFHRCNKAAWAKFEQGQIANQAINEMRWSEWLSDQKITQVGVSTVADKYLVELALQTVKEPGADDLMARLGGKIPIHVITNGFPSTQEKRWHLAGWHHYIDGMTVSASVGVQKPDPKIFNIAMAHLGIDDPSTCLMLGDNYAVDVLGAQGAGMQACWYQRQSAPDIAHMADYHVRHLHEFIDLFDAA